MNKFLIIFSLVLCFGTLRAMEPEDEKKGKELPVKSAQKVKLVSSDGKEFTISREAAELSGTIKNFLKDVDPEKESIPLIIDSGTLKTIIEMLQKTKRPKISFGRRRRGQISKMGSEAIVYNALKGKNFNEKIQALIAADYLDIKIGYTPLIKIIAYILNLYHAGEARELVDLLSKKYEDKKLTEAEKTKIAGFPQVPKDLIVYLKNNLKIILNPRGEQEMLEWLSKKS